MSVSNSQEPTKGKVSTSETGHAKNIANFQILISFAEGYGTAYNPSKESLKIVELKKLHQQAEEKLNATKAQKANFDNATNDRRSAFKDLKPLSTKIVNAFAVSGADALAISNAKAVNKKLQGSTAKKTETTSIENQQSTTNKQISTSQQSYDKQVDHFAMMIEVLKQNSSYAPNENELKVENLQNKLNDLKTKNTNLVTAYTNYSNAMIARNQALYDPLTGLLQTAKEVKQYIKSLYGASSPQYKQVSGLEFKIRKGE